MRTKFWVLLVLSLLAGRATADSDAVQGDPNLSQKSATETAASTLKFAVEHKDADFTAKPGMVYILDRAMDVTLPSAVDNAGKEIQLLKGWGNGWSGYKVKPANGEYVYYYGFKQKSLPCSFDCQLLSDGRNWYSRAGLNK